MLPLLPCLAKCFVLLLQEIVALRVLVRDRGPRGPGQLQVPGLAPGPYELELVAGERVPALQVQSLEDSPRIQQHDPGESQISAGLCELLHVDAHTLVPFQGGPGLLQKIKKIKKNIKKINIYLFFFIFFNFWRGVQNIKKIKKNK